jgi:hypothetical protein
MYNFASWGRGQYWFVTAGEGVNRGDVWYVDLVTMAWVRGGQDSPRVDCRGVKAACDPETGYGYMVGGPNNVSYWPSQEPMTCYM